MIFVYYLLAIRSLSRSRGTPSAYYWICVRQKIEFLSRGLIPISGTYFISGDLLLVNYVTFSLLTPGGVKSI